MIASVMAVSTVPELEELPELLKKLDAEDPPPKKRLSMGEWQKLLLKTLEKSDRLDSLNDWLPELAWQACHLHMVFLLEPNKMGCTDAMEHIKVTKSESFNRWF